VAQGRAFVDRGIGDRSGGPRESIAATMRRLAAILAADVAGYSRLMGADEEGTLTRLKALRRQLVDPKVREHNGRIVKTTGDGMLVEFSSVVDAVRCAVEIQRAMFDRNAEEPEDKRITFRVGVNLGDVIADSGDIYGDGVNIAARLEALAEPGGLCISRTVRDHVRDKLPYAFDDIGEQPLRNIARPVRVYALTKAAVTALPSVTLATRPRAPRRRAATRRQELPRLSIVVLPFANLSSDPEQEYFTDGITDDLTTDLSRISDSFVIARNTAITYKGKVVDAKQLGRELGVRYVLEGSVRRMGEQVRVNVQLIDAGSGAHLWADRFDTDRTNLPEAQSEITGRLARTLNLELVKDAGRRIEDDKVADPDARDLVTRGWATLYRPDSLPTRLEALRIFERALEIDPRSIEARIGIARVLIGMVADSFSSSVQQDKARAEQLLLEALDRDAHRCMAHAAMGLLRRLQNRHSESRVELEIAIALDPNNSFAVRQMGQTLMFLGHPEAAVPYLEKAIRLSPRDPNLYTAYFFLGWCHLFLDHIDKGIEFLRKAAAENRQIWFLPFTLAAGLGLRGDIDEAKAALAESLRLKPEMNSVARCRAVPGKENPRFLALMEKTVYAGLRLAGMPEE
jgi:adenylate cyclase